MLRYSFFFLTLFLLSSCYCPSKPKAVEKVYCDAENVKGNNFVNGDVEFGNGNTQSADYSRSGKYSSKLDYSNQFGLSYEIKDLKRGDYIHATVWRRKGAIKGHLVLASQYSDKRKSVTRFVRSEGDWELLETFAIVECDLDSYKVYTYAPDSLPTYFDDLTVEVHRGIVKPEVAEEDAIYLNLPQSAMDSISNFRDVALENGVISPEMKKYFQGDITINGKNVPINFRIKGDWTDHLKSDKWSFRIKIEGDETYHGMKKFSIQNPSTRAFMMEWFAHKLFEQEDILTTRYTFKVVYINGKNFGVYAVEEHFDKRLLENRKRREGPIVKYDEAGFWVDNLGGKNNPNYIWTSIPHEITSDVGVFSNGRTWRTKTLRNQFKVARFKMQQYRDKDPDVGSYFELDKMAKFIAMQDVINCNHGLAWHNQRNYFNPVTNLLEPIGYDCFMESESLIKRPFITGINARELNVDTPLDYALMQNSEFEKRYFHYLQIFSSEEYLNNAIKNCKSEMDHLLKLIQVEYPKYTFEAEFFKSNCFGIREGIPEYIEMMKTKFPKDLSIKKSNWEIHPNGLNEEAALRVYREFKDSLTAEYTLSNFHVDKIEVIGYALSTAKDSMIPMSKVLLNGFKTKADSKRITTNSEVQYFFYKARNCGDTIFRIKRSKWPSIVKIDDKKSKKISSYGKTIGDTIYLSGSLTFNKNVELDEGFNLVVKGGTKINLIKSAGILCYGSVSFQGTKSNPINVFSSDISGSGILIVAESQKVSLRNTTFKDLNTFRTVERTLTGAVTIYEGDVTIENCTFDNANCEDGLNLIRSDFIMSNSIVSNTYGDGFDADFCAGKVVNCKFLDTENDCIDFSGSKIEILNCELRGSGDKAISGGENSVLIVKNCKVSNANIAVASKDFSNVVVDGIEIENCNFAYAAYRKKAEFGGAKISVVNSVLKEVKEKYMVELESQISDNGQIIKGKEKFDIESMYAAFEK